MCGESRETWTSKNRAVKNRKNIFRKKGRKLVKNRLIFPTFYNFRFVVDKNRQRQSVSKSLRNVFEGRAACVATRDHLSPIRLTCEKKTRFFLFFLLFLITALCDFSLFVFHNTCWIILRRKSFESLFARIAEKEAKTCQNCPQSFDDISKEFSVAKYLCHVRQKAANVERQNISHFPWV